MSDPHRLAVVKLLLVDRWWCKVLELDWFMIRVEFCWVASVDAGLFAFLLLILGLKVHKLSEEECECFRTKCLI